MGKDAKGGGGRSGVEVPKVRGQFSALVDTKVIFQVVVGQDQEKYNCILLYPSCTCFPIYRAHIIPNTIATTAALTVLDNPRHH